jgi:hypothetical protein
MTRGPDFSEIRAALLDRIEHLARELVPDGHRNGAYWIGRNPTRADRHGGSFWVRIRNPAIGAFRDEAGVRGVDDGDVVRLVNYCCRHADLTETRAWCLRWLGWSTGSAPVMSEAERQKRAAEIAARRAAEEREDADKRQENARRAFGLWLHADKLLPLTFPGSTLDTYLKSRAIDLSPMMARGRGLPGALRFFVSHDYRTHDGELIDLPCMIALMSGPDGRARGVHRTWLKPDGSGKAELPEPKKNAPRKIWPAGWLGSFIRISKGAGDLSPEAATKAGKAGPLIVTEGIEDALACALAMPERRVWAAGTLGNIGNVPDLPCITTITVCADNDWGKGQAEAALDAALKNLRARFRQVFVARSPRGKDMNDLLKGERI